MAKNVNQCFPQSTSLSVLSAAQRYSVYCHWGKEPENIHIEEAGIREILVLFFFDNDSEWLFHYQNSCQLIEHLTANKIIIAALILPQQTENKTWRFLLLKADSWSFVQEKTEVILSNCLTNINVTWTKCKNEVQNNYEWTEQKHCGRD